MKIPLSLIPLSTSAYWNGSTALNNKLLEANPSSHVRNDPMLAGRQPAMQEESVGKPMILVVASQVDEAAHQLVAALPQGSAELLTPLDLSYPGWRVGLGLGVEPICI